MRNGHASGQGRRALTANGLWLRRMRFLRLQLFAHIAAIAMLLPSGAAAKPHYFCRMMDRVMASDCCAAGAESNTADHQAQARAPDCCERLMSPERTGANRAANTTIQLSSAALATILDPYVTPTLPPGTSSIAPPQARAPPALGPPLFIVHCALLS